MTAINVTVAHYVAIAKAQIIEDEARGQVPANVASFCDLHDHVDANEYGGFCKDDVCDALIEHFGGRDEHEGMPDGLHNLINAVQDEVDTWLKAGGLRAAANANVTPI